MSVRELTDPEHAWGKGAGGEEEEEDAWAVDTTAAQQEEPEQATFADSAAVAPPDAVSTAGERIRSRNRE